MHSQSARSDHGKCSRSQAQVGYCITVNDCTDLENVYDAVMCDHMVTSTRPNLRRQPPACRQFMA